MSLKQQTISGVLWSGAQKWGSRLFGVLVFFLLARLLEPADFGLSALAMAFIYFVQTAVAQGFIEAIVQRDKLESEHLDTAFWANAVVGTLLSALVIAGAPWLASAVHEPGLTPVLRWLTVSFFLSALSSIPTAVLQREFAYKNLAVRYLLGILLGGVVGVTMAFLGFGVWSLVAQEIVYRTTSTLTLWLRSNWRPRFRFSRTKFAELFAFESSVMWIRTFFALNRRGYDMLIGNFFGAATLGFYSLGYRITNILEDLFSTSLYTVALSSFSRIQNDQERMRRNFYRMTQLSSLLTFPTFTGLALVAPEVVREVFGMQWVETIPILRIFAFVGILNATAAFNYVVIKAAGKASWNLWIVLIRACITVLAFFISSPFGIVRVTLVYAVVEFALAPLSLIAVAKLIGIKYRSYFTHLIGPLVGATVMLSVVSVARYFLADAPTWVQFASYVSLGTLSYVMAIRLAAPKLFGDSLAMVEQILPKKLFIHL